jgi:transcriptional regulator GlxA family with amidase domain
MHVDHSRAHRRRLPPQVRQALTVVEQHPLDELTVGCIARAAGCSRRHLDRLFAESLGHSVHEYVSAVRMSRASDLLLQGHKVEAVAEAVGYGCRTNFNRAFAARFGTTPRQWRAGAPLRP